MMKRVKFLDDILAISPTHSANRIGISLKGYSITIPKMLKTKWENATVTAISFCVVMAANKAVTVVPILAPKV